MIRSEHLHKEISRIEDYINKECDDDFKKYLLKASVLQIKLLLNIRQNQVKDLSHQGVASVTKSETNEKEDKKD